MTNTGHGIWRFIRGALLLLAAICALQGYALAQSAPGASAPADNAAPPSATASAPTETMGGDAQYRLGSGDKLRLSVYGEDDLSGEFLVDASGNVQLPLLGQVKAAGMTIDEFVAEVTEALSHGYLKDPRVSVEVENYRPFYITGEVNKPGEYPYEHGLTVLGAVALAGGFTYRAEDSEVYVRHNGSETEVAEPANATSLVSPGDVIRVAERIF